MYKEYEYTNALVGDTEKGDLQQCLNLQGISFTHVMTYTQKIMGETPYDISRYPEYKAQSLREILATFEGESAENILLGNGTLELLYSILSTVSPRSVLLIGPLSEKYARICANLAIPYTVYSLQAKNSFAFTVQDAEHISVIQCEMTIVCSPNSITGALLSIPLLLYSINSPWLLLDFSCKEFAYTTEYYNDLLWKSLRPMLRQGVHLVTLCTFDHFFYSQSVPLAYIIAQKKHISFFEQKKSPYSLSPFAVDIGKKMIDSIEQYRQQLPKVVQDTYTLLSTLSTYPLFSEIYFSKEIGFVTLRMAKEYSAAQVHSYLLSKNIFVRLLQAHFGVPCTMLRIKAIEQMDEVYSALDAFLLE
ncbi:MAG: aminotransferase class I/II-fold pyridoxal phosphate-dependent enzyme [Desulfovibrionaceae bacterium]